MKRKLLAAVLSVFCAGLFAQEIQKDMKIYKNEIPRWVYELFVNNDEDLAKATLRLPPDCQIFYGAATGKNLTYVKMVAQTNATNACSKKLCEIVGGTIHASNVTNMELVKDISVDFYHDDKTYEVQVFSVYKMTANAWKKAIDDAQKWENDKAKAKGDFEKGLDSISNAFNDAANSIKEGVDSMSNEIQKENQNQQNKKKNSGGAVPGTAI